MIINKEFRLSFIVIFCLLFYSTKVCFSADVVSDLSKVEGINNTEFSEPAKKLLKENGFVVIPTYYRQIFSPYIHRRAPAFVTVDSVYHTFHVIYEEQIKNMEGQFASEIQRFNLEMIKQAESLMNSKNITTADSEALKFNLVYFSVAAKLIDDNYNPPEGIKEKVSEEVDLINQASGLKLSPLFGYPIDYSDFKPRSFYTKSIILQRYFRCMSWYGDCAFRLVSDTETRSAMYIAQALAESKTAMDIWSKIDKAYSAFLAKSDDLTPQEYIAILNSLPQQNPNDAVAILKEEAGKLHDPLINSMNLSPEGMNNWKKYTKGMRVFGKRYVIDSEVFTRLTYPAVESRGFPSGLDIMAVNGSSRAKELIKNQGDWDRKGYEEGFEYSTGELVGLKQSGTKSNYIIFLSMLDKITAPKKDTAFPFMKTKAYEDKSLLTSLAAWSAMRHAWQLTAKQSVTYLGIIEYPPSGWVEPNQPFYDNLALLIDNTIENLSGVKGVDLERINKFKDLLSTVQTIVRKQQDNMPLNNSENQFLESYGEKIANLGYFEGNSYEAEEHLPWMSLIADVHTELESEKCLEVGIGPAMPIYVVIPWGGKEYLAEGGVYSYYEFKQDISDRLTDDEWTINVDAANIPPMPAWTSSFIAGYDVNKVIEKLKQGEKTSELDYVSSPEIVDFLEKAICPGGVFENSKDLSWAVEEYGKKAGRKAVPLLMKMLKEGNVERDVERKNQSPDRVEGVAEGAARALMVLAGKNELPELKEMLDKKITSQRIKDWRITDDEKRKRLVVNVISAVGNGTAKKILIDAYKNTSEKDLKKFLEWQFVIRGTKDMTPMLLESFNKEPSTEILNALSSIWGNQDLPDERMGYFGGRNTFPESLPVDQEIVLRDKVEKLFLELIDSSKDEEMFEAACKGAGRMKLSSAIPLLEKKAILPGKYEALYSLMEIDTVESHKAVLRLNYVNNGKLKSILVSYMIHYTARSKDDIFIPTLIELLNNKSYVQGGSKRACDYTVIELQYSFFENGPKAVEDSKIDDKIVNEWKEYLFNRLKGRNLNISFADAEIAEEHVDHGMANIDKGNLPQAISDCTKALKINPSDAKAYITRGIAYDKQGSHTQAISDFNKAMELNPAYAEAYYNRGLAYYRQGKLPQAISDYTKAIEIDPYSVVLYANRGAAYGKQGNYTQAISDCTKAIEIDPNSAVAYSCRGSAYDHQGNLSQAVLDYSKAIEINSANAESYYNRGTIYIRQGNFPQAIFDYTKAVEIDPNYADAYCNRGSAYYSQGNFPRAILDFSKAIKIKPDLAAAYVNRAMAYSSEKEYDKAWKDIHKAEELGLTVDRGFINKLKQDSRRDK
ncbi:MAG: DUF3160 domain-containing protein [Candidatus Omnitrophota bacterium]